MIGDVVGRRGRQDDRRLDAPQGLGDPAPRLVVVEDRQVAEFQADVLRADQRGRRARFLAADRGDRLGIVLGTAAIPGVIVAIVTAQPASRSRINVPAHWNSTSSG